MEFFLLDTDENYNFKFQKPAKKTEHVDIQFSLINLIVYEKILKQISTLI